MQHPLKINLGSGKDFLPDYLNIDINDYWNPDIVANVSTLQPSKSSTFITKRFGTVTLAPDRFNEIIAIDVLEHVPDLVATVTHCLTLLKTGGTFRIVVPYELSLGAWRDPTHLRAFNEHSWLYYTDWFWYLGWETHRFVMRNLKFSLSPLGEEMRKAAQPVDVILRTPRMTDAMEVVLEKIELSPEDRKTLQEFMNRRRVEPHA